MVLQPLIRLVAEHLFLFRLKPAVPVLPPDSQFALLPPQELGFLLEPLFVLFLDDGRLVIGFIPKTGLKQSQLPGFLLAGQFPSPFLHTVTQGGQTHLQMVQFLLGLILFPAGALQILPGLFHRFQAAFFLPVGVLIPI